MTSLFKVMDQRSASLPSLLLLKGKLDMLDAQLGLRQSLQSRPDGGVDSEDEDNVIYVEGQEELDSGDDEDAGMRIQHDATTATVNTKGHPARNVNLSDDGSEDDEDMPLAINGIASSDDDDEEDEDEASGDELFNNEAEESDDDGSSDAEESLEENEDVEDEEDEGSLVDFIAETEDSDDGDGGCIDAVPQPASKKPRRLQSRKGGRK
jgi:U3 small nucleolar RNA-associated protein 5